MSSAKMASMIAANRLLATLPSREIGRLAPFLQNVALAPKQILCEPDEPVAHVVFPTSGIVARMMTTEDGASLEVGLAGWDGMAGLSAFSGAGISPYRESVLVPGEALRLEAPFFIQEIQRGGTLSHVLRQYLYASFCMATQYAVCNQLHKVEQRCCRLLLMLRDRTEADDFPLTHESLALLLGVRRASVSEVARRLQNRNLIRYRWGRLKIVQRREMEALACRCYHNIKACFGWQEGTAEK